MDLERIQLEQDELRMKLRMPVEFRGFDDEISVVEKINECLQRESEREVNHGKLRNQIKPSVPQFKMTSGNFNGYIQMYGIS